MEILVVGGTGMLRPAVEALARRGDRILSLARRPEHGRPDIGDYVALTADWQAPQDLATHVSRHISEPLRAMLLWAHGDRPAVILNALRPLLARDVLVIHLIGSGGGRGRDVVPLLEPPARYRAVVLGHQLEAGRRRWLTHEEISAGALDAFDDPAPVQTVGILDE